MYFSKSFSLISDVKRGAGAWGCNTWLRGRLGKMLSTEKRQYSKTVGKSLSMKEGHCKEVCEQVLWIDSQKCKLNLYKTVFHNITNILKMDYITCWKCRWVELSNFASGIINSNGHIENWSSVSYKIQSHTGPVTQKVHLVGIYQEK